MTILAWPVNAVAGAPAYSARDVRQAQSVYLAGATTADPFGARSGVRPGTSPTTVTVAAGVWTIGAHAGVLDLQPAIEAAPYLYKVDAVGGLPTGAVTPAHATLARTDIVWLRIDDPAEVDGSTVPAVVAGYTAGTTGGLGLGGGNPATPARGIVLAWVNVPASGGGAPTVTWKAPYAVAAGAPIPVRSLAERDALFAYDGLRIYRLDTHVDEVYDGSRWTGITAGFLYGEYDGASTGAIPTSGTNYPLGAGVTFTLASARRLRYVVGASFWSASASQVGTLYVATIVGSSAVLAGAGFIGFADQVVTAPGATTAGTASRASVEHTQLLPSGTYTAFCAVACPTGAAMQVGSPYTAVYDAGPA